MKRIDSVGATSDNHFTEGDPESAVAATRVSSDYMNIVEEELCGLIEAAGLTLDQVHDYAGSPPHDTSQVKKAILALIAGGSGGVSTVGHSLSPYPALTTKKVIPCDTSGGNVQVNLPDSTTCPGEVWELTKVTNDSNQMIAHPSGSQNINGVNADQSTANFFTSWKLRSLGSLGWLLI